MISHFKALHVHIKPEVYPSLMHPENEGPLPVSQSLLFPYWQRARPQKPGVSAACFEGWLGHGKTRLKLSVVSH